MLNSLVKKETAHIVVFNGVGVPTPDPSIQHLKDKAERGENKLDLDAAWELIFDATQELIFDINGLLAIMHCWVLPE